MINLEDPAYSKKTTSSSDADLIKLVLRGESSAFGVLALRYKKRLMALGVSFFHNIDDAEDFVQDVLVKLYISLSGFRGDSQFSTWLMRVAYNTAINSVKRKKEYTGLADDFDLPDTDDGPEDRHLKKLSIAAIRDALGELPDRYRICIDMYFFYDMPYAEIAEVTGLPVNTIKSHVFRAKNMLRNTLSDEVSEIQAAGRKT